MKYRALVVGVSAGGLSALGKILPKFPADFPLSVIIVQHISPDSDSYLVKYFQKTCKMKTLEIEDKIKIEKGRIYFAPPNYHILIDFDKTFSLSVDEKVNFSRPSIDVLFHSAADFFCDNLIGLILTGANNDGAAGMKKIKEKGGYCIVQNPETAEVDTMPLKAMEAVDVDQVLELEEIGDFIINLISKK
jgi:two-component system chemotaxis response regulator CheB